MTAGQPERELARYLSQTTFSELRESTVAAVHRQIVWTIGSCLLGLGRDRERRVAETLLAMGGPGSASVIGCSAQVSPSTAGMVHGYLTKLPEYEDKYWKGGTHGYAVATAVVPAALAVAEGVGDVPGSRVVSAIAVAVDFQARLLAATPRYDTDCGWNATYLYSALGAAAASAHIMQLGPDQTLHALGIAFAQVAGTMQCNVERSDVIPVQMGFGVRNGVVAAELASRGMTGPTKFLTGVHGLFQLQMKDEGVDLASLTDGLGDVYLTDVIGFKGYPCGAVAHPALEALRAVVGGGVAADDIVRITIVGTSRLRVMVQEDDSESADVVTEALFSLPWAIACAALDGDLLLSHFESPALENADYHRVASRVQILVEEKRDTTEAAVEFADGRRETSPAIYAPRGHPDKPLTTDEVIERYWDCWRHGSDVVSRADADVALRHMLSIEQWLQPGSVLDNLRAESGTVRP